MISRQRSFSLLELLVSLTILVIALLGLVAVILSGQNLDALTRERAHAMHAATSKAEEVLATDWDTLLSRNKETFDATFETANGISATLPTPTDRTKSGLITVSDHATHTDLRVVEVSVRWRSVIGKNVEVKVNSCIAKH